MPSFDICGYPFFDMKTGTLVILCQGTFASILDSMGFFILKVEGQVGETDCHDPLCGLLGWQRDNGLT